MSDGLHRLVYYSRNSLSGSEQAIGHEIQQVLASSRRNNAADGITGALMFNPGCFAQVLDGPRMVVERTFERIQRDPRHEEVLLQFERIQKRGFQDWSMAFVGHSAEGARHYGGIAGQSGFDPARLTGDQLFELLSQLVVEEEGLAAVA
jgi:hypothetical protein